MVNTFKMKGEPMSPVLPSIGQNFAILLCNIVLFRGFAFAFIFRHYKITIITLIITFCQSVSFYLRYQF